nr:N-acetylmuramoyl-L-alanine amidase [Lysobacter sp. GX 14042]
MLKHTHHVGKIKSRCYHEGTCSMEESERIRSWGWAPTKIHNHEKTKPYPDRFPLNEDSVGIEVVSQCLTNCGPDDPDQATWEAPTAEQTESIRTLVRILKRTYDLTDTDVHEHDVISYKKGGEGAGLYIHGEEP